MLGLCQQWFRYGSKVFFLSLAAAKTFTSCYFAHWDAGPVIIYPSRSQSLVFFSIACTVKSLAS